MRLTIGTHSFEALSLEGTMAVSKAFGFKGVDISAFHARGHCSYEPDELGANPQKFADDFNALLDKYELDCVDLFPQFELDFASRSINHLNPAIHDKNVESFRGIVEFCKLTKTPGVTMLPGVNHEGRSVEENLDTSAAGLQRYVDIAAPQGVQVRFEAHTGSLTDTPELAIQLLERVPDARLTLDYSHFMLAHIPEERIDTLIPYAGHFHIRAARPGKLQTRLSEGTLDFVAIVKRMQAAGYDGCASLEYVSADVTLAAFMDTVDTLTETLATKELLEPHLPM
ncbi:MAG: sugar phosphate isomerase/epimerase [Burkholderiales bacterium]|nr:sugar phosphate isomerase/epimerase [Anaerolineae bacterium]